MSYYSVLFITFIISIIVGWLCVPKKSGWQTIVLWIFIAALIGLVTPTLIFLQKNLQDFLEVKTEIVKRNNLQKLEDKINSLDSNDPIYNPYKKYLTKINNEIEDSANGIIILDDEDEVIVEWNRIFESKSKHIKATNIISPNFWLEESNFSKAQVEIQKNAIKNDYKISRLFIYDNFTDIVILRKLAEQQKNIGIDVRFIHSDKFRANSVFLKNSSIIRGAEDFVISDFNIVLLTISNPRTKGINHGFICNDRKMVDVALEIFDNVWRISEIEL